MICEKIDLYGDRNAIDPHNRTSVCYSKHKLFPSHPFPVLRRG